MDNSEILEKVKIELNSIICNCFLERQVIRDNHERKRLRSLADQAKMLLYMINHFDQLFAEDNYI